MRDRCRHETVAVACVYSATALLGGAAARAAEWSVAPTVVVGVNYDTNRSLTPQAQGSGGVVGNVQAEMDRKTETLTLTFTPQLDFQYFTDPTIQRANDYGFLALAAWSGERATLALSGRWSDQSLLTAERYDTGIVDYGTRDIGTTVSLNWSYAQSELYSLALGGGIQNTDYVGTPDVQLQNSRYLTLNATESYIHSERLQYYVAVSGGDFTTPASTGSTNSYSTDVGFRYSGSERFKMSADIGVNRLEYGSVATTGLIFDLSANYATVLGGFSLAAQRNASPSGYGVLTERDTVNFSATRALSERLSLSAGIDFYRTSVTIGPFSIDNRTYSDVGLTLGWRSSETWTLSAHVTEDGAQTENGVGNASGWNVGVAASWAPYRRSISR